MSRTDVEAFLKTERLTLRQFTSDDVDNLVELDRDPEVMRYINGGRATPREEIEREVLPSFLQYYARPDGYGFWAAVEKGDRWVRGLVPPPPTRHRTADEPELGYRLRRSATFHADWPDKIEGDEEGDVEYALTRAEWEARQK